MFTKFIHLGVVCASALLMTTPVYASDLMDGEALPEIAQVLEPSSYSGSSGLESLSDNTESCAKTTRRLEIDYPSVHSPLRITFTPKDLHGIPCLSHVVVTYDLSAIRTSDESVVFNLSPMHHDGLIHQEGSNTLTIKADHHLIVTYETKNAGDTWSESINMN